MHLPALAAEPWHRSAAFVPPPLRSIADEIDRLRVHDLELTKAFDARNDADAAFATDRPSVQFVSSRQMPSPLITTETRLSDALEKIAKAPLSARVATAGAEAATPELCCWLEDLAVTTGRTWRDADAYMTPTVRAGCDGNTASLGWHIDDVDVLLVMLRGSKRFRVAGTQVGSRVAIDCVLRSGDALYIPSLRFHSGGDTAGSAASDYDAEIASEAPSMPASTMLSIAMPPAFATDATEAVGEWRRARDAVRRRLPDGARACNSWAWARSSDGRELVGTTLRGNAAWQRFSLCGRTSASC